MHEALRGAPFSVGQIRPGYGGDGTPQRRTELRHGIRGLLVLGRVTVIAAIAYVIIAGVVAAMHPSSDAVEMIFEGILWPQPVFEFVWGHMVKFSGPLFR